MKFTSVAVAASAVLLSASSGGAATSSSVRLTAEPVVMSSMHEMYPSTTASDWHGIADHIASVTVTSERRGRSDAAFVERTIVMSVDAVHWSRDGAQRLPGTIQMPSYGWVVSGAELRPIVVADAPRIEPGHTYLVALIHLDPRCNDDDGLVIEEGWSVIGSAGVIAFDGRLGTGEIEMADSQTTTGPSGSIASQAATVSGPAALVALVRAAPATERHIQPGERQGC